MEVTVKDYLAVYGEYTVEEDGGMFIVAQDGADFAWATRLEDAKQIALIQALMDRDDFTGRHMRELVAHLEDNEVFWNSGE